MIPTLPLAAVAYVAGTLAAAALGGSWWLTLVVAAGLAALGQATGIARLGASWAIPLVAAVALAAAGHARYEATATSAAPTSIELQGARTVVGVARADTSVSGITSRVDLDVEQIDGARATGGVRLTIPAPPDPIQAGDRIEFRASLTPPRTRTPEQAAYLRSRGIEATAAFPAEWRVLSHDAGPFAVRALRAIRRWSLANLERSLPEPEASLAAGLLLGEQRTIPPSLTDALRVTGTTHLVVVSGQNIAIVSGVLVGVLSVWMPRRRAAVMSLAALPAYVVLVGAEPPVVRAAVMAIGITAAAVAGRRTPAWIFLAYAAAIMLAVDPQLASDISFQLSAAATAGVLVVAPPLREAVLARIGERGPLAAVSEAAAVATGAGAAVLPVQAAAFGTLTFLQVPANALVAPLYAGSLLVAACGALLGWLPPVATVLRAAGSLVPHAFVALVELLAGIPGAAIPLHAPLGAGLAWYALLAAALTFPARREPTGLSPSAGAGGFAITATLAVVAGGLWMAVLAPQSSDATVTVLDVGQGLAVLVRDGDAAVLIDAGPPDASVIAALSRAGQGALDAAVLTHADADHTGGLEAVQRRVGVTRLLAGDAVRSMGGRPHERIDVGDRIHLTPRATIEVLAPPVAGGSEALASDNDRGLVLLVTIGERRILLPADIEASAERWLARHYADLRADVLIVPHHGSRTSSTAPFVEAVKPSAAIISVGARNTYGHPHPDVLARYRGLPLYRTDLDGDVTVRSDGTRLWVAPARTRATVAMSAATP